MEPTDLPFQVAEVAYYLAIYATGFLCGIAQTLRSGNYRNFWHCVNSGVVSGFLGFAIVARIDGNADDFLSDVFGNMAVAAAIGLTVHLQEFYVIALFNLIAKRLGLPGIKIDENGNYKLDSRPHSSRDSVDDRGDPDDPVQRDEPVE